MRNPWDRLVSSFHFLRDGGLNEADQVWGRENLTRFADFDDFVRNGLGDWRASAATCTSSPSAASSPCPGRRGPQVDFVGKMENIAHDFKVVAGETAMGVRPRPARASTRPPSAAADYRSYYSPTTRAIVERHLWRRTSGCSGMSSKP